jgi:uncharacterized protein
MLFPFRNANFKKLLLVAGILISIGILWDISDYHNKLHIQKEGTEIQVLKEKGNVLSKEQEKTLGEWEKIKTKHTQEEVNKEIEKMHQSYFKVMMAKVESNQFMQTWFPYRIWPWDILSFMLIGMAFFKLRIFHGERTRLFYLIMMITGYLVGLSVNYYETRLVIDSNFDAVVMSKADQTYQIGRLFTTMGHVGLFMLFIQSGILRFLQKSLAAVGKMALSNYLTHSIVTSIIFYGDGFSMYGKLERFELYYIVAGIWIFQLIVSPIWLKHFLYGPAEWIWRSLTYQKMQAFRIKTENI